MTEEQQEQEKKEYTKPEIIHDIELETKAGSPIKPWPKLPEGLDILE